MLITLIKFKILARVSLQILGIPTIQNPPVKIPTAICPNCIKSTGTVTARRVSGETNKSADCDKQTKTEL